MSITTDEDGLVKFNGAIVKRIDNKLVDGHKELLKVFEGGRYNRKMRSTEENEVSSRSHLLLMIKIVKKPKDGGEPKEVGKFTLIDLAGSESLKRIGVDQSIYEEGMAINFGLDILGDIIRSLSKGMRPEEINYDAHVLTKAMKDSLGGNAKTLMLVTISPSMYNID